MLGPMRNAGDARAAVEVIQRSTGLRTCTTRLPITPRADARACILKDLGDCSAPCVGGEDSGYDAAVQLARDSLARDPSPVVQAMANEVEHHAQALDFERAAHIRDGVSALVDGSMRMTRLAALRTCRIVAVRRNAGAWDVASVVNGALAGTRRVTEGVWAAADAVREHHEALMDVRPGVEEQELVARWLELPGTRLLYVDGDWAWPVDAPGRHQGWIDARRADQDFHVPSRRS